MQSVSKIIVYGTTAALWISVIAAGYLLWDIDSYARIARDNLPPTLQWSTVMPWQWYSQWFMTVAYMSIGWVGLVGVTMIFAFAKGELFTLANSTSLRYFAWLLLAQAIAAPIHYALATLVLSLNHPAGTKMLSLSIGSSELSHIALAMILWVISQLLVEACKLQNENRQFV